MVIGGESIIVNTIEVAGILYWYVGEYQPSSGSSMLSFAIVFPSLNISKLEIEGLI